MNNLSNRFTKDLLSAAAITIKPATLPDIPNSGYCRRRQELVMILPSLSRFPKLIAVLAGPDFSCK
jgi:hypothetical protein